MSAPGFRLAHALLRALLLVKLVVLAEKAYEPCDKAKELFHLLRILETNMDSATVEGMAAHWVFGLHHFEVPTQTLRSFFPKWGLLFLGKSFGLNGLPSHIYGFP